MLKMGLPSWLLCIAMLAVPGSGLRAAPAEKSGVVFVAAGVGGLDMTPLTIKAALSTAGLSYEVREFVWTHGKGHFFRDLQDIRHLLEKARELADQILRVKEAHPDRPIYLLGRSGGAGLALAAAELLPAETLERIILLSPA